MGGTENSGGSNFTLIYRDLRHIKSSPINAPADFDRPVFFLKVFLSNSQVGVDNSAEILFDQNIHQNSSFNQKFFILNFYSWFRFGAV